MEKLLFPKDGYYLTQGYGPNSFTHQDRKALDISGKNSNAKIYAPFSGYVAKVYYDKTNKNASTMWLVSNEKLLCADGHHYFVVAMFTHPAEIKNFKKNSLFIQGEHILNDGNTGYATGKHLDFEIAIYKNKEDIKANWYRTPHYDYGLINAVNPCDYMIMKDDTKVYKNIYNGKIYKFKKESEVQDLDVEKPIEKYTKGKYQTIANVRVRTGAGIKYPQKKVKDLTKDGKKNATSKSPNAYAFYKKGTLFTALQIIKVSDKEYWAKTPSGYVNIEKDNIIASKKVK